MKRIQTLGLLPGSLFIIFQLIIMICVSDILDMLNLLKNPVILYLPVRKINQINHVNQFRCFYRLLINISICAIGFTNSFVVESIYKVPYAWLFGGLVTLIMLNCCFCCKKIKPTFFRVKSSNDSIKIYECVHRNTGLIYGTFIWSITFFLGLVYMIYAD